MAGTILFVVDESDLRFMVASYFECFGMNILAAGDADEAMRVASGVSLCAIILDVNLPGKGSGVLLDYLKQNHPKAPIILYTGRQPDDELVTEMLARGAQRYLLKDGSLEKLLATAREFCG
jgi:two-component system phosphate regulon response regulator OmpR